jgi:hypothetical protein
MYKIDIHRLVGTKALQIKQIKDNLLFFIDILVWQPLHIKNVRQIYFLSTLSVSGLPGKNPVQSNVRNIAEGTRISPSSQGRPLTLTLIIPITII